MKKKNKKNSHGEYLFFESGEANSRLSLNKKKKYDWIEESFTFDNDTGKQVATPQSTHFIGSSFIKKKVIWCVSFIVLIFIILVIRVSYLQLFKGEYYAARSVNNRERVIPIPSERGMIYDKKGIQLTQNIPNFSLAMTPQDIPRNEEEKKQLIHILSQITQEDILGIEQIIEEYGDYSYESINIKEDISYDVALRVQIASADLPGISIKRGSKRLYQNPENNNIKEVDGNNGAELSSLSHILGYLGKLDREELDRLYEKGYLPSDTLGKYGIEKTFEEVLRGSYGKRRIEVNVRGREQANLAEQAPVPGNHLYLSIDAAIQNNLERIIRESLQKNNKSRASGIVSDPNTGQILALVSIPSFDNNDFSGGISEGKYRKYLQNKDNPLFNRSISGTYPSGSTVKISVAAAALQEGVISKNSSFLSNGGISVGQWFFPDWLGGGHGITNVRKSLAQSVNTFYYYIGGGYKDFTGLGVSRITKYLKQFGLYAKLGIDLPGEQEGFLPSIAWKERVKKERWYVGDTYNLSIGQGDLLATPLQINFMTNVVANGGTLFKPQLVTEYVDPVEKKKTVILPSMIRKNIIDSTHLKTIRLGMRDCVLYGSCRRLNTLPVHVAGKTGTAQWNSTKENHAWFTSFAPMHKPEISVTILVEEGGEGSKIAVPIADEFYRWWYSYQLE